MINSRLRAIENRDRIWDTCLTVTMFVLILSITIGTPFVLGETEWADQFLTGSIAFLVSGVFFTHIGTAVDNFVRRNYLKSYFIEDCGSVVKLHGSVRALDTDKAARELRAIRPGSRLSENPSEEYGCTMAAVCAPPSPNQTESKTTSDWPASNS